MRICDRCGVKRAVKATERIYIETEGQELDLCPTCFHEVVEFATTIPKRKNKTGFFGTEKKLDTKELTSIN